MECPVCHGHAFNVFARDNIRVDFWIDGDQMTFAISTGKRYGNGYSGRRINYCPECGRDLRNEDE